MKTGKFPITITEKGVSAIIRKTQKVKNGKTHAYYIIEYFLTGKRKQVWKSNLGEAEAHAREACIKIGNGNQAALDLADRDRLIYLRANNALAGLGVPGPLASVTTYAVSMSAPLSRSWQAKIICASCVMRPCSKITKKRSAEKNSNTGLNYRGQSDKVKV